MTLGEALSSPSGIAWRDVTAYLDADSHDDIATIDARLVAWPDALRTVPGRWLKRLLDGEDEPRLAVTRTFDHVLAREPARHMRFAWATTPRLARLTTLRLLDDALGDEGARALASSTTLGSLVDLRIGAHVGPEGVAALSGRTLLRSVRTLGLNRNRIGVAGVQSLVESPHLEALEAMHLGRNALDDSALASLARGRFPRLTRLDLDFNAFGARGLRELVSSPLVASVRELNLSNNPMTSESCAALAASPHLSALRVLFLHNCALTDDALDILLTSRNLGALGNLAVSENQLGIRSFRSLASCAALRGLYELDVCHNRVDPMDAETCLRASANLTGLTRLCV
jgi:hypothetical protein